MLVKLMKLQKNEEGATAIEYGLIVGLIAIAAIAAFEVVGTDMTSTFINIATLL